MKQCTEYVRGLRYKLRMMGIAIPEPTYLFGDNQLVLYNTTMDMYFWVAWTFYLPMEIIIVTIRSRATMTQCAVTSA